MKKRLAFLMAGLLLLSGAAGCGSESVQTISEDVQKNAKEVKSLMGDVDMDLGISIGQSGISMGLDVGLEGDWEAVKDPGAFHFNGTVNMSLLKFSMDMELYGVQEDEDTMILYTKVGNEWSKSESEIEKQEDKDKVKNIFEDEPDRIILDEKTEKVNGKDAFVLHTTVTGDDVKKALKTVEGVTEENLEEINLDDLEAEVVMKVYKEEKLPASLSLEIKDGLKNLNPKKSEYDAEVGIEKCTFTANIKEYNNIDKIEVPKEALEAKDTSNEELLEDFQKGLAGQGSEEDMLTVPGEEPGASPSAGTDENLAEPTPTPADELQGETEPENETANSGVDESNQPQQNADGSYVLTDYADEMTADIKVPDGFHADYMDKRYFAFSREPANDDDTYVSAAYTIVGLDEYYTEDSYVDNYLSQEDDYEEYGYKSLKCDGPGKLSVEGRDISYITVQYSFGEMSENLQIVFWTRIDENHLLECTVSESIFEKDATIKADEEWAKTMFSGVSFENGDKSI